MGTTASITTMTRLKTSWPQATLQPIPVLDRAACDACGADRTRPIFQRPDSMQVVECEECGLMYLSPMPTIGEIESWYGRDYFSGAASAGRGYSDYWAESQVDDLLLAAKNKLALVGKHVHLQTATALEIGCATGETCNTASKAGARVTGCDLSSDAIQIAQCRYPHIEFHAAPADQLPFSDESFDTVLAFELIEHLSSPSAFVREVHRVLRPGGVLALTTPNVECGRRVGWHQWTGFLTSFEHLYFFNLETLGRALSRNGISVVGVYSQGEGRIAEAKAGLKSVLRWLRLFGPAKALHRAVFGPQTRAWVSSARFHTLMVVARKT